MVDYRPTNSSRPQAVEDRPTVTVAICTWNRAAALRETLATFLRLAPADFVWELLVVDNGSTDDSGSVPGEFAGRLPVRCVREPKLGLSCARNRAVREAAGDIIVWTDDDVVVESEWLNRLVHVLVDSSAEFAFGRSRPHWAAAQPAWFSPLHYGRFSILDYGDQPFTVSDPRHTFYGVNFAATKVALLSLGGFDETAGFRGNGGAGLEDTELCRLALARGLKLVYAPDAVVEHVIPAHRTTKSFYRGRVRTAADRDYRRLTDSFTAVTWMLGLPRFLFLQAARDVTTYVAATVTGRQDVAFDRELRVRRFFSYVGAAARHGQLTTFGSAPVIARKTGTAS